MEFSPNAILVFRLQFSLQSLAIFFHEFWFYAWELWMLHSYYGQTFLEINYEFCFILFIYILNVRMS